MDYDALIPPEDAPDNDNLITPDDDQAPSNPQSDESAAQTPVDQEENQPGILIDNDAPEAPAATDDGTGDGDSEQQTGDETDGTSASPETPVDQPPAKDTAPAAVDKTVENPGDEFVPKTDYSFDITLADGSVVHIAKPEDIELLPENADFGSPANLMKAQAKLNVMTAGLEQERRQWEADKQTYEAQQVQAEQLQQRVTTMVNEINYLQGKGKLPPVDPKLENADWNDPEIRKQPGVKERMELLEYRAKENTERLKLGLSEMSVIEALTQMQNEKVEAATKARRNRDAEARKQRGGMVTGSAPSSIPSMPDDMIVGPGGSLRDLNPAI